MHSTSNITPHHGSSPEIAAGTFVHHSAQIIGEVSIAEHCSIWCNAVIRGDVNSINIGSGTNIQDLSMLHVSHKTPQNPEGAPLIIGSRVTIGHSVILHGCTIHDECLVGMGSIIMDKAVLEPQVLVGAGSLVPEGKVLQSGYLYLGRPVKQLRALTADEIAYFNYSAEHYIKLYKSYGV
ncbi:gamma carbonic anhydrase family protein [Sulfurirhabdus autotrophica]|uniref:Carbonic anhydrase/acetyltransferase-like protein (Isoleucine patch superfamily) n=1 Tax=Sulfurirhabdus autotrophica TaxID=1706046 RepID=A0A4R3Y3Q4_9PROT|nr:gamma carbonic anhydrase family protein [Sulfurirhabdus autotrophica]TCV86360.1 carbonic anhydrase/acetyltransferase-like protein (isoleucine patch superfamily) [Sulfurirhabdus autotrophica]